MIMRFHTQRSARSRLATVCLAALALLVLAGVTHPLAAQEAEKKKDDAKTQAAAASKAPGEGFKFGVYEGHSEIEVGYRAVDFVSGNFDVYRSMINLGEGPKLLRSSLSLRSNYGTGGLFDRLEMSMNNWGGDPYNTFHLNLSKSDKYEFRADYRNLNYYNFLPTYANPLLGQGSKLGQHSLDVTYRSTDLEFKLFPTSRFRPYVAYAKTTGFGPGYTTTTTGTNDFVLNTTWHYAADDYRGGIEMSLPKLTLIVEQGYRLLKNDTGVTDGTDHAGNVNRPYLGQTTTLVDLSRSYHDRATMPVTKIMAKYNPFDRLKLSGRYIYSSADLDSALGEIRSGNLISLEERLYYRAAADAFSTSAKKPNHNAAFEAEFSPLSNLTIIDQFDTRSFHVSGSSVLATTFFNSRPLSGQPQFQYDTKVRDLIDSYLSFRQSRNQIEAELEVGHGFAIRGGHRFTSSEAILRDNQDGDTDERSADVTQNAGVFGFLYRPNRRMHFALDYEINRSNAALTRTDLLNYQQFRFDWRVEPVKNLTLSGRVGLLTNRNEQRDIDLQSHNRNYSFALNYEFSQRISLNMDYQRSNIFSDMAIILPQFLTSDRSVFDERGSAAGGSLGIDFYKGIRGDGGLRAILSAGDFPFNYYQPFASITIPLGNRMAFKTYWQNFGYNEKNSDLQDHRSHLFTLSLAFSY